MPVATLLTIPFSHFCEKARWALDRAGVSYVEQGHVPGLHRIAVRRAGSKATSVPVLVLPPGEGGRVLGDSRDIVAHADAVAPPRARLFPDDPAGRRDVEALEAELDGELGPHIRRILYFHLLPSRALTFGLMDQGTPRWEQLFVRALYPGLRRGMRRFMNIDARTAEVSRDRVLALFDAMERRLADGRPFLLGDRFTAADLTLASLAGPAVQPPEHPATFPREDALPPAAAKLLRETQARPLGAYMRRMYRDHRRS
jgi:glutathione S-transferase